MASCASAHTQYRDEQRRRRKGNTISPSKSFSASRLARRSRRRSSRLSRPRRQGSRRSARNSGRLSEIVRSGLAQCNRPVASYHKCCTRRSSHTDCRTINRNRMSWRQCLRVDDEPSRPIYNNGLKSRRSRGTSRIREKIRRSSGIGGEGHHAIGDGDGLSYSQSR
jgi:hypothetical protein